MSRGDSMKKWLNRLKGLMLYGGLEKEQYWQLQPEIDEANRKSIVIISVACMLIFGIRCWLLQGMIPQSNQWLFLVAALLFGVLALVNRKRSRWQGMVHVSAYLFMVFYLGLGILSAVAEIGRASCRERVYVLV